MKWNDLTMKERSDLMSLFLKNGIGSLSDMRNIYDGEHDTEGGYTEDSLEERERIYEKYDPTGGLSIDQLFHKGNRARGEEDQYWRAYLGLDNAVPKMNPRARTSWDDEVERIKAAEGELPSEFYGTTPKMDQYLQVIADTLNTGKILRNWDEYKEKYPDLYSRKAIERMYLTGKRVLENPDRWTQVGESRRANNGKFSGQFVLKDSPENNEIAPLGMLADFGMMWSPEENAIYIHDTYDFPSFNRRVGGVPKRPREMKIRGRVSFNPKKGSYLLRDNMKNYYNGAKGIGSHTMIDRLYEEILEE